MPRSAFAQAICLAGSVVILCTAAPSAAKSEERDAEQSEPLNTIGVKAAMALEFDGGASVGGGANASYERELIPKDLQIELVFGAGAIDKAVKLPIALLFTHAWVPNEVWEPDVGLGGTVTIEGERNASGGRDFSARFGVTFAGGTHIWLWGAERRWGLDLDLVYTLQVTRGVRHELFLAFGPSVRF